MRVALSGMTKQDVRLPRRLGYAVPPAALQCEIDGRFKVNSVPGRDEDGFRVVLRAHGGADHLAGLPVPQVRE